jgi:hypothetical protein
MAMCYSVPLSISTCNPMTSSICKPALVVRCDGFFLWNFVQASSPSTAMLTANNDQEDEDQHRAPLNGGCGAMAWCTANSTAGLTSEC